MEELLGNILTPALSHIVVAVMGSIGTLGTQWSIKHFARKGLLEKVELAYMKLRLVCEPGTIDPKYPGNVTFMKSDARDTANSLYKRLERAGYLPPDKRCDTSEESLQEWFRFLEIIRIRLG